MELMSLIKAIKFNYFIPISYKMYYVLERNNSITYYVFLFA